jgi:hypothetical protein
MGWLGRSVTVAVGRQAGRRDRTRGDVFCNLLIMFRRLHGQVRRDV